MEVKCQRIVHQLVLIFEFRGSCDHPGILIELFKLIFEESKQPYEINPRIFITFYSTQKQKNCYIDLLLGQRYEFFSRKNFDVHHNFFMKQIQFIREFLIALKIATTRFQQCCSIHDSFVCEICLQLYDEFHNLTRTSYLNFVHTNNNKKIYEGLCRRIQNISNNIKFKGQDGGDLINFLEQTIKKSKIIILYTMVNHKTQFENSIPLFQIMDQLYKTQKEIQIPQLTQKCELKQLERTLNEISKLRQKKQYQMNIKTIDTKSNTFFQGIKQKYETFAIQSNSKIKNYIEILQMDCQIKNEAYQKNRFPVSLQIKEDNNIKSYFIAKIYKLSDIFQKEDMRPKYDKLNVIKNQILISLKAFLKEIKKYNVQNQMQKIMIQLLEQILKFKKIFKLLFDISSNMMLNHKIFLQKMKDASIFKINSFQNVLLSKQNNSKFLLSKCQISIRIVNEQHKTISSISNYLNQSKNISKKDKAIANQLDRFNKHSCRLPKIIIIKKNIS